MTDAASALTREINQLKSNLAVIETEVFGDARDRDLEDVVTRIRELKRVAIRVEIACGGRPMRRKYVYDPETKSMVEVTPDFQQAPRTHFVQPDTPGYLSHSGLWVEGKRARRDDLKRMGCRPWEGMEAEKKEAQRQRAYEEAKSDRRLDEHARRAHHQMDPSKRRLLERG